MGGGGFNSIEKGGFLPGGFNIYHHILLSNASINSSYKGDESCVKNMTDVIIFSYFYVLQFSALLNPFILPGRTCTVTCTVYP